MVESIINSQQSLDAYIEHLRLQFDSHKYLRTTIKTGKQRTLTQNRALHMYCDNLAKSLNNAGWDMRRLLKDDFEIPWTGHSVKNTLWREIQKAMFGKESTTEPETHEYSQIYEVLNRVISQRAGVFVPWPCKENMNG